MDYIMLAAVSAALSSELFPIAHFGIMPTYSRPADKHKPGSLRETRQRAALCEIPKRIVERAVYASMKI